MSEVDSKGMKDVVRYMRSANARALEGKACSATRIAPDEGAGRCAACWLHAASSQGPRPVVFELHGGGFALGDARKGDALRAWVRDSFDAHVVGIDYRLAPEHPAPAALEDALAVMALFASDESPVQVDRDRFYLLGYSAGANLALASTFSSEGRDDYRIAGMSLHYPFLDAASEPERGDVRSVDLPYEMMVAFNEWYVGDEDPRDPTISPLFASDEQLAALPPVSMRPVEGDSLEPSAEALRDRMEKLGCSLVYQSVPGMYHGYIEDAEDVEAYLATVAPETVEARPKDFVEVAAAQLKAGLEDVMGPAVADVAFPGAGKDVER